MRYNIVSQVNLDNKTINKAAVEILERIICAIVNSLI